MALTFEEALKMVDEERPEAAPAQAPAQAAGPTVAPPSEIDLDALLTDLESGNRVRGQAGTDLQSGFTPQAAPEGAGLTARALQAGKNALNAIGLGISVKEAAGRDSATALNMLGRREGVPFDISTGVGLSERTLMQFATDREEQRALLLRMNPNAKAVRFNSIGEPVLTVKDPKTGEERDILANPIGLDISDLGFVLANAPNVIGGSLAARGLPASPRAIGALSRFAQSLTQSKGVIPSSVRMGVVGAGAQAVADTGVRTAAGLPVDFGDIGERFAIGATVDTLQGLGAGVFGKGLSRVATPLNSRGPIQVDAEVGAGLWRKAGVDFPFSPAETTGNQFLGRSEARGAMVPGSASVFRDIQNRKVEAVGEMQRILLGAEPSAIPRADLVGEEALRTLGAHLAPFDWSIDRQTSALLKNATADIQQSIASATKVPSPVLQQSVGLSLIDGSEKRLSRFWANDDQLYNKVYSSPFLAGQGRNIDATPLAEDAKGILKAIASFEKDVEKSTGILGPSGKPLTKTVTETKPLESFVDSNTVTKLKQLAGTEGGRFGLSDMIELRRDIDTSLYGGPAIGGLPERRLGIMRDALTDRIKGGLDELDPSGALRKDWEIATEHHHKNIKIFKDIGIVNIFKSPEKAGHIGINQTVSRALNNEDVWQTYSDFFGAQSQEMNLLKRAFADRILGRLEGSDTVDANGFLGRLQNAYQKQPRIADDVFGKEFRRLRGFGLAADQAGRRAVNTEELANLLDRGTLTDDALRSLIEAQDAKAAAYRNRIFRQAGKSLDGPDAIQPSRFVDEVVFSDKVEPGEIRQYVADVLSHRPKELAAIRQRAVVTLLENSSDFSPSGESITFLKLAPYLEGRSGERLAELLGPDTMGLLRATRDVLRPGAIKEREYKAVGGIAGGMAINNLQENLFSPKGLLSEVSGVVKQNLMAAAYTMPPIRKWLSNTAFASQGSKLDRAAFVNLFVAGEPVLEALINTMGPEAGRLAAIEIKQAIDGQIRNSAEGMRQANEEIEAALKGPEEP